MLSKVREYFHTFIVHSKLFSPKQSICLWVILPSLKSPKNRGGFNQLKMINNGQHSYRKQRGAVVVSNKPSLMDAKAKTNFLEE